MLDPIDNPAPEGRTPGPARLLGWVVLAFLVIAILLLATGVVNFEQRGFF